MQRIENYGSFLQAYGLKKTLEKLGHKVVFVDYEVEEAVAKTEKSNSDNIFIKFARMLLPSYRKYRKEQLKIGKSCSDFVNQYRNVYLQDLGVSESRLISPKLDVLVIGSDEVFNCTQANSNVGFSMQLFGKDNNANRLISYAASFGNTSLLKLERYGIKEQVTGLLKRFDAISVRDANSREIIEKLVGYTPNINLDPVLIYDFPEVSKYNINISDYIVVYAYSGRITKEEEFAIKQFAKKKGKKIITLGFYQPFSDEYYLVHPLEVLAYIKNADYVITDTFHGTVFSIKYKKQFVSIIRDSNREKLGGLLDLFSLKDRSLENTSDMETILDREYDTNKVQSILDEEYAKTKKYLEDSL